MGNVDDPRPRHRENECLKRKSFSVDKSISRYNCFSSFTHKKKTDTFLMHSMCRITYKFWHTDSRHFCDMRYIECTRKVAYWRITKLCVYYTLWIVKETNIWLAVQGSGYRITLKSVNANQKNWLFQAFILLVSGHWNDIQCNITESIEFDCIIVKICAACKFWFIFLKISMRDQLPRPCVHSK